MDTRVSASVSKAMDVQMSRQAQTGAVAKPAMSGEQMAEATRQAREVNVRQKHANGMPTNDLGKDAFLKLLVTEMSHQDPTQPMADREFISQMAQFSSLEQMNQINTEMQALNRRATSNEAYSLLGREIDSYSTATGRKISGEVTGIIRQQNGIKLLVGDAEVDLADVSMVHPVRTSRAAETQAPRTQPAPRTVPVPPAHAQTMPAAVQPGQTGIQPAAETAAVEKNYSEKRANPSKDIRVYNDIISTNYRGTPVVDFPKL